MHIIMIGCEYAGKTTLAAEMSRWLDENMGVEQFGRYRWHDHFELPFHEGEGPDADLEAEQVLAMTPTLLEKYSRYMIHYHMFFFLDNHHLLVNWYYADAVYAPLYYGYGGTDEYADRQVMARHYDAEVMEMAPDTVLVLLKASPEVIRQRKAKNPHPREILKDTDVETVAAFRGGVPAVGAPQALYAGHDVADHRRNVPGIPAQDGTSLYPRRPVGHAHPRAFGAQ